MKLDSWRDVVGHKTVFHLEITDADVLEAPLDEVDLAMLRRLPRGIADTLLDLQTIVFRIEQKEGRR